MRILLISLLSFCSVYSQTTDPLLSTDYEAQQKWVDSVYSSLTLDQKIGQLFMVMAFSEQGEKHFDQISINVTENEIGGVIFSLGGPLEQTNWLNKLQSKSKIPLLIGMDAEWGVAMRLDSVQPFPWNMTLGAIQDNKLIEAVGERIGEQAKRLGIHINFAPSVDINTNPKNPIIGNRSFGENKENVSQKGIAFMKGMHKAGILSSAKHFPGHGDTSTDSHLGLPSINFASDRIDEVELYPFKKIINAGISSVMVAHLDIPAIDSGIPSSLSYKTVQTLLKDSLDFKGLVITDALNMKGASGISPKFGIDVAAFVAGNDILLIPNDVRLAIKKMKRAFKAKLYTPARLEVSVKKILKAKYLAGLGDYKSISTENLYSDLNTKEDDYLIAKAMQNAITVVNNKDNVLPLDKTKTYGYLSLGDDEGTFFKNTLIGNINLKSVDSKTQNEQILEQLEPYKEVIISFHRSNASPWKASNFSKKELELIALLAKQHTVILNVFVKPYALSPIKELSEIDALVIGYQNNKESQVATAEIILGKRKSSGRLPVSISSDYPVGHGIDLNGPSELSESSPLEVGLNPETLNNIDALAQIAIDSLMTPGMQILVARHGKVVYNKSFGYHTYEKKRPVLNTDLYDLASLTKILTTLPLIINEVDQGTLSLETKLGALNPNWAKSNKSELKVKDVLSHYARLTPWIPFYKETIQEGSLKLNRKYYRKRQSRRYPIKIADNYYGKKSLSELISTKILESKLRDSLEYKYSDLPYFFLKDFLEKRYGKPLDIIARDSIYRPLGLKRTSFNPNENLPNQTIIPSEIDTYFRNQELKGEVHDMGAAMLGGVGGHAGLFSNATEVGIIMQLFLNKGKYGNEKFFASETFDLFNRCLYCEKGNRSGVGFDKPQLSGRGSTCGCVPKSSFGHSGFTGTYAWADPENELIYVFLSNRTYPTMNNNLLSKHDIRTRIQQYIYDSIIN
ncbi:serine hydrolase [Flavobacteriaceae bacterium]|uniref:glycoside hydrolase family 3 N-terminal domain-containing protein n=1 Tax=Candidatus Arcticimaribacter forsetii TaxID=2820661 RepID=UPI0020772AB3|nr:glycoside hydrolase family 3 N-terminal domain-containing protein [Candidatus Arcticimaribacter forsetii]MDB2329753.1 serine hydrolase [Flavobacteriaceae bacterium]MDB2345442.1 serine hydrolase [Flavobacteriaceae bacterium]MDB4674304.1 serine hydrolase [Flavobacteriaceae bacterium]